MLALVTKTAKELDATPRANPDRSPRSADHKQPARLGVEGVQSCVAGLGEEQVLGPADPEQPLGLDQRDDGEPLPLQPQPLERQTAPGRGPWGRAICALADDPATIVRTNQSGRDRRNMDRSFPRPVEGIMARR